MRGYIQEMWISLNVFIDKDGSYFTVGGREIGVEV